MAKQRSSQFDGTASLRETSEKMRDELYHALKIDKHDLDSALLEQPDLYYRVSQCYSGALSQRDEAKSKAEEEEAKAARWYREQAEESSERLTDTALKQQIALDDRCKAKRREYRAWVYLANKWEALRDAYSQRSYALKELVNLYTSGYFTDATGSSERAGAATRQHQDSRAQLAVARKEKGK